jgi:hypothetical protein
LRTPSLARIYLKDSRARSNLFHTLLRTTAFYRRTRMRRIRLATPLVRQDRPRLRRRFIASLPS